MIVSNHFHVNCIQNLRNALDSMYNARVPALWKKVRVTILIVLIV